MILSEPRPSELPELLQQMPAVKVSEELRPFHVGESHAHETLIGELRFFLLWGIVFAVMPERVGPDVSRL